jgi:hypothetical protein
VVVKGGRRSFDKFESSPAFRALGVNAHCTPCPLSFPCPDVLLDTSSPLTTRTKVSLPNPRLISISFGFSQAASPDASSLLLSAYFNSHTNDAVKPIINSNKTGPPLACGIGSIVWLKSGSVLVMA